MLKEAGQFGRVAVLMGGHSAEREISISSGIAVFEALTRLGIDSIAIDVKDNPIKALTGVKIDRAFNMIHGRGGEDGVIQGLLEMMSIPYTGSGVMASALAMDKLRTKLCWQGDGLNTPEWHVLTTEDDLQPCANHLGFPVMVKPALEGSSLGMSKAHHLGELKQAFLTATTFNCEIYAERWVQGTEYTVAMLDAQALSVIRLETEHNFYDYDAKYHSDTTRYHCPSGLTTDQEKSLQNLALTACDLIGVKGWGRVDVFIDHQQHPQLIEVNTVPGMTRHSLVPMAAKADGMTFDQLVWKILATSLNG